MVAARLPRFASAAEERWGLCKHWATSKDFNSSKVSKAFRALVIVNPG